MTRRFFEGVEDVQELRKKYKELLKQYHPDNGGSVEIMQEINSEYDRLFKALPKDSTENAKSAAGAADASASGAADRMLSQSIAASAASVKNCARLCPLAAAASKYFCLHPFFTRMFICSRCSF